MSITNDNIKHGSFLTQNGRPPWYNTEGESFQSYLIGISGGSASGKTSVAQMLIKNLNIPWVVVISMDSFYRALNAEEKKEVAAGNYDFDHPNAFDFGLLKDTLLKIKSGKKVDIPIYCFKTHSRTNQTTPIYGANIIIFEGILAFHDPKIVELMDLKIFVDTASDIRLARRLKRDIVERGRDPEGVLIQYNRFVKPGYDEYIQPTIKKADLIIPRGLDNVIAIDMVSRFTKQRLEELPMRFRWHLAQSNVHSDELPSNLIVLKQTKQLKCIHTILRDEKCPRDEFIFYTQRLTNLIVEFALAHLPIESVEVETSVGEKFQGTQFTSPVCGITVLRAGGCMEPTLRKVCKDCPIGKILIQSDSATGEPELHYCKLPNDMKDYSVFLMDATIATGAAAIMAIKVLLDHDVKEEQIIFLSYLATPQGVHSICKAFPKVRIITSMVDPGLKANTCFIEPGIGNYGDRYFGTED